VFFFFFEHFIFIQSKIINYTGVEPVFFFYFTNIGK